MWHNLKTWLRKCHKPDNSPVLWELSVHFTRFYLPWWGGVLGLRKFISPFHRVQMMQPQNYKSHIVVLLFCVTLLCCSVTKLCLTLWSGLPFPSPGDLPEAGMELESPALAGGFFTPEPPGKPKKHWHCCKLKSHFTLLCKPQNQRDLISRWIQTSSL